MILTEYNEKMHIASEKEISRAEGRAKGRAEGRTEDKAEIISRMIARGMSDEEICDIAGCDVDFLGQVKKSMDL